MPLVASFHTHVPYYLPKLGLGWLVRQACLLCMHAMAPRKPAGGVLTTDLVPPGPILSRYVCLCCCCCRLGARGASSASSTAQVRAW